MLDYVRAGYIHHCGRAITIWTAFPTIILNMAVYRVLVLGIFFFEKNISDGFEARDYGPEAQTLL